MSFRRHGKGNVKKPANFNFVYFEALLCLESFCWLSFLSFRPKGRFDRSYGGRVCPSDQLKTRLGNPLLVFSACFSGRRGERERFIFLFHSILFHPPFFTPLQFLTETLERINWCVKKTNKNNFWQWITWFSHRWRTQQTAIINANRRNLWVIKHLNANCTLPGGNPREEYVCLRIGIQYQPNSFWSWKWTSERRFYLPFRCFKSQSSLGQKTEKEKIEFSVFFFFFVSNHVYIRLIYTLCALPATVIKWTKSQTAFTNTSN